MAEAVNYNRWIVSMFSPYVGSSLLEVGIGHGGFYELLPNVRRYVGLDLDSQLVEIARRRHPENSYIQADVADPSLAERLGSFSLDTVLCVNVLEYVPNARA